MKRAILGLFLFLNTFSPLSGQRISAAGIPEPDIYHQTGKFQWSEVSVSNGVICSARIIYGFSLYSIVKFHNIPDGTIFTMQGATCEKPTSVTAEERVPWVEAYWGLGGFSVVEYGAPTQTPTLSPTITLTKTLTRTPKFTSTSTATPIAAPWPTIIFTTNDNDNSTYLYTPYKDEMCTIYRVGTVITPPDKNLMVVKFLVDQETIPVNIGWCEDGKNYTPEERVAFTIKTQPCCYTWERSVAYYVGENMQIVTLTKTASPSNTPTVTYTSTPTASITESLTSTKTPTATETETEVPSNTPTETETPSITSTPSIDWIKVTPSNTRTRTPTMTFTPSKTATKTSSPTRTATRTATPVLKADWEIGELASTIIKPQKGDICWGQRIGNYTNVVVEFTKTYNFGIYLKGPGGCIKSRYYALRDVITFLKRRGITLTGIYLPEADPTATVTLIPFLPIDWQTSTRSKFWAGAGTICWGVRVADFEYKVVNFTKDSRSDFWIVNGACYAGEKYSPEDIYNYLKRNGKPINGIVNTP